ncbi:MAG TPA: dihydrolipoyl dehydrogenase [Solirubrobacteraceae bacterium]|jgi:dihydrolipoamide dehydrogenase|nr:dihydrolipoyl dehydrogenase [Solirubrobacteraceae bacterium]
MEVNVPDIGDFADVPVIEILVSVGDEVGAEDPLVTLESDKATMDVPAPFPGVVSKLAVSVGDRVSEGSLLLTLDGVSTDGEAPPADGAPRSEPASPAVAVADEPPPAPPPESAADGDGGGHEFQVVVLGSGPGGYTAAFRAADLGLRTALIERYDKLGGVCLNVGCIPSKALLHAARVVAETEEMATHGIAFGKPDVKLPKLLEWKQSVVDRLTGGLAGLAKQRQVEVIHGVGGFTGPHALTVGDREVTFDNCIIAAGSQPAQIPGLPDDPRIIDSTGALSPSAIPKRLLVIGGGIIGLEMACVYDALGSKVTVVEMLDHLLTGCDPDIVRPLAKRIQGRYEDVLLENMVAEVRAQKNAVKVEISGVGARMFDQVLVAVGRRPNGRAIGADAAGVTVDKDGFIPVDASMRTNVPGIYAIGDIVGGPMLAHKATHEGKVAAEVISGLEITFDAKTIPSVAYTDPEVAWMGLTETVAKAEGIEYEKAIFPWGASGRALGLGRDEGLTKLLVEPGTQRVLGAGIVGVGAGDLIAETVLALEMGANAEDIALTVHPHPTLSETIAFAAELADGTITDLISPAAAKARRAAAAR